MKAQAIRPPTAQDTATAQLAVSAVRPLITADQATTMLLRSPDSGEEIEVTLPAEALHLLIRVLTHMANGHAVAVTPVQAELTTQQAADLLGVSRPYIVRLLEGGKIPFHRVGTHRRVLAEDVLNYKARRREESRRVLDELTREAQELGLGY